SKTIADYVSYKFTPEAPIQIAEKILPHLIKATMKDELPSQWDEAKRDQTIQKLIAKAESKLHKCINPFKERIKYGASFEESMVERKKLEEEFCKKNSLICQNGPCEKTINLLTTEPNTTDMQRIQGCVLQ